MFFMPLKFRTEDRGKGCFIIIIYFNYFHWILRKSHHPVVDRIIFQNQVFVWISAHPRTGNKLPNQISEGKKISKSQGEN